MTITLTDGPTTAQSRARRLRATTSRAHDGVDTAITTVASLATLEGYIRFLQIQYQFHRDIEALYADVRLCAAFPGLAERCRLPLVIADMLDLGVALPKGEFNAGAPVFVVDSPASLGVALGWLYVAEGSTMGAALLRKEAAKLSLSDTFGARHLAPAAEGPAAHWRAFTAALDAVALSGAEEAQADEGARAAFARVQAHIDAHLG